MNIVDIINKSNFTELEINNLQSIFNNLSILGCEINFIIDSNLDISKYNCKTSTIKLKNINYSEIIHEVLHVELVYMYNFPCLDKLIQFIEAHKLHRAKKIIIDITNDIHHFIFYNRFVQLTKGIDNVKFISNENQLTFNRFRFDYMTEIIKLKTTKIDQVKYFYNSLFIPLKYSQLLLKGNINWTEENLLKEFPDISDLLIPFFNIIAIPNYQIINFNDIPTFTYIRFLVKFKKIIFNPLV